jgi:hypothetical protein
VLGDTAYGGAELRHVMRASLSVELVAPPPAAQVKANGFAAKDFDQDIARGQATCPRGHHAKALRMSWSSEHGMHFPLFTWDKKTCAQCDAHEACVGKRRGGKVLKLHPYEQEVRRARQQWDNPDTREIYRVRSQCERLVNQVVRHGGRQSRAFGLQSAQLQAHAIAMRCNLALFAKQMLSAQQRPVLEIAA